MTVYIQNTAITNTFDYWRNRTNELAFAMSNSAVTVNSNTATGNAAITGTFTANTLVINSFSISTGGAFGNATVNGSINSTSISFGDASYSNYTVNTFYGKFAGDVKVGNSTVNVSVNSSSVAIGNSSSIISIKVPSSAQVSNAQFFLNANGSWTLITQPVLPIGNGAITTTGTTAQLVDNYAIATFNSGEYLISAINNSANGYATTKLLTYHDGGNGYITEYATMNSNGSLGLFSANTDGTNLRLWVIPVYNSTTFKFSRILA
jgi:hypothetical protein